MTDETENVSELDANDNVAPSDDDTPDDFDYFDPDEEQDTEAVEETEGNDDETDEAEAENEAEDQEAESQEDEEPDAATVKLDDGTEVPLEELKKGYFRQNDYTRKTQELANKRNEVEAGSKRIQSITDAFVEHLSTLVPSEPDVSLAMSDPNAYTKQAAQHKAALAQVEQLINIASQAKEAVGEVDEAKRQETIRAENAKLMEKFPKELANREQFFGGVQKVANELGFTDKELGQITDHRVFALAHWAKVGMEAEKAKATVKAKAAKAPPATPRKPGQGAAQPNRNAEAMRKLKRTGSLEDALAIDFD